MQNTRNRKPASEQWTDASPSDLRPLTATVKYGSPQPLQPMPEDVHRSKISSHSVVSIVTLQDAPQPCPELLQRLVHPAAQRLLNLLQLGHHPLVRRLSPDREPALRTGSTLMNKSEECKRLRFLLAPPAPVLSRISAELQQPRLLRMEFQPKLCQPLPEFFQEPLGIGLVLESHHQIVRVADNDYLPEFSLIPSLPSPSSACGFPHLFGWLIGTTPESDSSATCASGVRPLAFPDRPVTTSGVTKVSWFSCMKFLSVRGVYDYAGPGGDSRCRHHRCCLPRL